MLVLPVHLDLDLPWLVFADGGHIWCPLADVLVTALNALMALQLGILQRTDISWHDFRSL